MLGLLAQLLTYGYLLIAANFFSSAFTLERLMLFLAEKTVIIATHNPELLHICNKHYAIDANGNITESPNRL